MVSLGQREFRLGARTVNCEAPMKPKIVMNHSSPFKVPGVRDLLERIAALESVERVIPGRMERASAGQGLRLTDAGIPAGQSGRKYTVLAHGIALELFLVPAGGGLAAMEAAVAALPEYVAQGNVRRRAEAEAAAARAARIAAARLHHGPRRAKRDA
jgi:hypothetical protein